MNVAKDLQTVTKQRILIVEDEPMLLEILKESSEQMGFEVLIAANGNEAMDILKVEKVSIILSDINMPRCSGLQLLTKCRKQNILSPFVFVTGNSSVEGLLEAVRLGAFDFLLKPFEFVAFEKMLNRVAAIAERQEYIDELLQSIGRDVAPQTHIEINNLRRQINLLRTMAPESE